MAGTAAWRSGHLAEARRHAERAWQVAVDDASRVSALTQLIRVAWEKGRWRRWPVTPSSCLVQLGRLDEARAYLAGARQQLARWSG